MEKGEDDVSSDLREVADRADASIVAEEDAFCSGGESPEGAG